MGEGLWHCMQMLYALCVPPGPQPFKVLPKPAWAYILLHHSLGLVAGTFAYFHLTHLPVVQLLVAVLLSAVLPGHLASLMHVYADLGKESSANAAYAMVTLLGLAFVIYARFFVFLPLAYRLVRDLKPHFSYSAICALGASTVLFAAFSVLSLAMCLPGIVATCRARSAKDFLMAVQLLQPTLNLHSPASHIAAGTTDLAQAREHTD